LFIANRRRRTFKPTCSNPIDDKQQQCINDDAINCLQNIFPSMRERGKAKSTDQGRTQHLKPSGYNTIDDQQQQQCINDDPINCPQNILSPMCERRKAIPYRQSTETNPQKVKYARFAVVTLTFVGNLVT